MTLICVIRNIYNEKKFILTISIIKQKEWHCLWIYGKFNSCRQTIVSQLLELVSYNGTENIENDSGMNLLNQRRDSINWSHRILAIREWRNIISINVTSAMTTGEYSIHSRLIGIYVLSTWRFLLLVFLTLSLLLPLTVTSTIHVFPLGVCF